MVAASKFRAVILTAAIIVGGAPSLHDQRELQTGTLVREIASLQQENESLQKQRELASGNSFYLVLDPYAGEMTLAVQGTALHRYSIVDVQLGAPEVAFVRSSIHRNWSGVVWSGGFVDPQPKSNRVELKVSGTGSTVAPALPPVPALPEVAVPAPASYFLRYDPGLVIEIRHSSTESGAGWRRVVSKWSTHARETLAALSPSGRSLLRLRIVLKPEDADSLYRSLPPATKLLIAAGRRSPQGETGDAHNADGNRAAEHR